MFLPTARFERAIFALQVQRLTTWPSRRLIGQISDLYHILVCSSCSYAVRVQLRVC
jgi:hypothetical protein